VTCRTWEFQQAIRKAAISPGAKLVGLMLATRMDKIWAYIPKTFAFSLKLLTQDCGYKESSKKSTENYLRELKDAGLLDWVSGATERRPNLYFGRVPHPGQGSASPQTGVGQPPGQGSASPQTGVGQPPFLSSSPKPSSIPSPKAGTGRATPQENDLARTVLATVSQRLWDDGARGEAEALGASLLGLSSIGQLSRTLARLHNDGWLDDLLDVVCSVPEGRPYSPTPYAGTQHIGKAFTKRVFRFADRHPAPKAPAHSANVDAMVAGALAAQQGRLHRSPASPPPLRDGAQHLSRQTA
jgi:hypothetical protein